MLKEDRAGRLTLADFKTDYKVSDWNGWLGLRGAQ
jgi:hypothetical protein